MVMIACVRTGTKYDDDYVLRLQRGVKRHLPQGYKPTFVCFTNDPVEGVICSPVPDDLPGWWAKLHLFSLGKPLVYFDLDTVIVGDLSPLLEWEGFGIIKDWNLPGYNSSVMKLTGDEGKVWAKFRPGIMTMLRGDQDWLNLVMPNARTFPREWFPSMKADECWDGPPSGAIAVNFHGFPKPHQCDGWVKEHWV